MFVISVGKKYLSRLQHFSSCILTFNDIHDKPCIEKLQYKMNSAICCIQLSR